MWRLRLIDTTVRGLRNLCVLAAAALFVAGCGPRESGRPPCPAGKVCLLKGNGAEPATLDPAKITGTWEDNIASDAIIGLVQDDAEGRAIPGMAERWTTSPDGRVWTFYLRDALWSDGVAVTADDFVFALRRIMAPQTASEYASLLYVIENAQAVNEGKAAGETLGVRALSPKVLEIRLTHPAPYLPELAKHQTMYPVPKHVVEKWGDAWVQPGHFVGNGPFKIVEWRLGDYVRSVKNPRFYDAAKVCVDEIRYYPTTDAISGERRVKRGELDINDDIQSNRVAFARQQMPAYVRTHTYLGLAYLAFNSHVKAFQDLRVRTALAMAIDREFITGKLLRGGQVAAYTFVPPGVANYQAARPPVWANWPLARRQAAARVLLAQAGYGPDHPLHTVIKHRNSPDPMLFMPAIQADWKEIGVHVDLMQSETQIAYASYRNRDFEIADAGWVADFNDAMSFLYLQQSTTGTQNYGDYNSPVFDALLAKADNEPDAKVRAGYLAQAESVMLRDASVTPIYFLVNKNLVSPRVTGWVDNIIDHHRARYLCLQGARAPG